MNKKKISIISLIISIISLLPCIIQADTLSGQQIILLLGILFAIIGFILGFVSKKEGKGLSIAGIVIGSISFAILIFALIGIIAMKAATNCVDQGNGTAVCYFNNQKIEVPTSYLTEEQMKK